MPSDEPCKRSLACILMGLEMVLPSNAPSSSTTHDFTFHLQLVLVHGTKISMLKPDKVVTYYPGLCRGFATQILRQLAWQHACSKVSTHYSPNIHFMINISSHKLSMRIRFFVRTVAPPVGSSWNSFFEEWSSSILCGSPLEFTPN